MTGPQATLLAALCSLLSAVLVAWISGAFDQSTRVTQATIGSLKEQTVEAIRQEGVNRTEEIRQLTARIVEETKTEGTLKLEKFKLQRDLIVDAITTRDREEAQRRLRFFAKTGLIPDYQSQVLAFTDERPLSEIPTLVDSIEPRLNAVGSRYNSIVSALVVLARSSRVSTPMCTGFAIAPGKVLVMSYCLTDSTAGLPRVHYVTVHGQLQTSNISKQATIEFGGSNKKNAELAVLTIGGQGMEHIGKLTIRAPILGEPAYIIGLAPEELVEGKGFSISGFTPFISENCRVTEVQDFVGTDCLTTSGTAGSPIFAERDGALISVVAWSNRSVDTNGPLLHRVRDRLLELANHGQVGSDP